ncbi:MAG: ATP-binding cassette domain-containing protein [bacterium]
MERKVVLEVKGLSKYFGGIKAVDDVDLQLYENEIIGLVGDNGAGKSTLIKTISGLYRKNAGKIYINGEEADISTPIDARNYGIETVYQDQGLIPVLDAASNLYLGREKLQDNIIARFFKIVDDKYMKKETTRTLKELGIELKDINSGIFNLSGGQRQTVAIGRAIHWRESILIFDEPTNNLGVKQERKVLDLIRRLRHESNVSIIVITHNITHIFELVDRIIVLRNGKKVGEKMKEETNPNEIVSMIIGVAS